MTNQNEEKDRGDGKENIAAIAFRDGRSIFDVIDQAADLGYDSGFLGMSETQRLERTLNSFRDATDEIDIDNDGPLIAVLTAEKTDSDGKTRRVKFYSLIGADKLGLETSGEIVKPREISTYIDVRSTYPFIQLSTTKRRSGGKKKIPPTVKHRVRPAEFVDDRIKKMFEQSGDYLNRRLAEMVANGEVEKSIKSNKKIKELLGEEFADRLGKAGAEQFFSINGFLYDMAKRYILKKGNKEAIELLATKPGLALANEFPVNDFISSDNAPLVYSWMVDAQRKHGMEEVDRSLLVNAIRLHHRKEFREYSHYADWSRFFLSERLLPELNISKENNWLEGQHYIWDVIESIASFAYTKPKENYTRRTAATILQGLWVRDALRNKKDKAINTHTSLSRMYINVAANTISRRKVIEEVVDDIVNSIDGQELAKIENYDLLKNEIRLRFRKEPSYRERFPNLSTHGKSSEFLSMSASLEHIMKIYMKVEGSNIVQKYQGQLPNIQGVE